MFLGLLNAAAEEAHKKSQRPHENSSQRGEYRDYREKKERERLEREKQQHHQKPGAPPISKHLQPGISSSKPPHGHHRAPMGVDPKLKMHHRPSSSREQIPEQARDPNAHVGREPILTPVSRDYNRETNGRESRDALVVHREREHRDVNNREVHNRDPNKDVQKHVRSELPNKVDSDVNKIESVDKQRFDPNRQKAVDPKLLAKHDPNRHKYPKRPDAVPNVSESKKPVLQQSAQDKNSFINKQTNSTSQKHKSPFSDTPKSVPLLQTPPAFTQKNGNHAIAPTVPVEKQVWPESVVPDEVVTPPPKRQPSLFSPEKTTPPKKTWPNKTPPSGSKRVNDIPQLPNNTIPQALSPFASPPPKPTPGSLRRHRNSSSGSEPELRPVVKKLDQISGFENIIRDSKMGIKLAKVPDIIQPICDRSSESPAETSISKDLKPPEIIKPFNSSNSEILPLSQPLVNGIETDPTLISNLLKEVPAPAVTHLPVSESTKSPQHSRPAAPQSETEALVIGAVPMDPIVQTTETSTLEKHKSEHHHKSEKKKKKDKHKHKDKDKSKDEKKKKHKDKDKERHKTKMEKPEEAPLKITIAMDKIHPPPEPSGLKVKISKDRLQTDNLQTEKTGSLKIKISKDAIQYNSVTDGAKKREREKTSPVPGPPAKIAKTSYNRNPDTRQNGRNSYAKVSYNNNNSNTRGRYGNSMPPRMPPPQLFQQNPPPQIYVPNYPPPNVVAQTAYMYPDAIYHQFYAGYQMYHPPDMYVQQQALPASAPPPLPDGPPPNDPPPPPPE